jgi:hypothetical protein
MTTVTIAGETVKFTSADVLQAGGEGIVYRWQRQAVKLYHRPTARRDAKLRALLQLTLRQRLPPGVLIPLHLALDADGQAVGFVMESLSPAAIPLRRLSQPLTVAQNGWDLRLALDVLSRLHETLMELHRCGLVVGDLNDHNLFVSLQPDGTMTKRGPGCFWIDVDSFQFDGYPCPVALDSFLDPTLYDVRDLGRHPVFSPESDWYAFAVLAVKLLLLAHPFGGTHHQLKSLRARAQSGVTLLAPGVLYPVQARPWLALNDLALGAIRDTFEGGERSPFPREAMAALRRELAACPACGLRYWQARPACPGCQRQERQRPPVINVGSLRYRCLLETDGAIASVATGPAGEIVAVLYRAGRYTLLRGGPGGLPEELPLFAGAPGYRFTFFDAGIAVSRYGSDLVIVLRIERQAARQVATLPTAVYDGMVVIAGTRSALYRVAGNAVLRGELRPQGLVEEIVMDARRNHTQLWGSLSTDMVIGAYRLFARHHFFLLSPQGGAKPLSVPNTPPLDAVHAIVDARGATLLMRARQSGQLQSWTEMVDERGATRAGWQSSALEPQIWEALTNSAPDGKALLHATDAGLLRETATSYVLLEGSQGMVGSGDRLYPHPQGLLIRQPQRLWFLEKA